MARIERLLSINMAVLAVLGTTLLGMGQLDFLLPLLILASAVLSVHFTDRQRVFYLNRHVANVAALVAVGVSLYDFADSDRNQQLLAIANLLVYLQVVVLFQEKNTRIYWQLAMLSLLQVVVAAALNYSVLFGLLLGAYMFVGLATLALFYMYREASRYAPPVERSGDPVSASPPAVALPPAPAPVSVPSSRRRWPVQPQPLAFSGGDSADLGAATTSRQLVRTTSKMGLATLVLTALAFIIVPRFGNDPWRGDGTLVGRSIGFSEEVTLGALGEIESNSQLVMRVKFVDDTTNTPIKIVDSPLWRGSVVTEYVPEAKRWSQDPSFGNYIEDLREPPKLESELVRQEITLEPMSEAVVFAMYPVFARSPKTHPVKYDGNRKNVFRPEETKRSQSSFDLYTNIVNQQHKQERLYPERRRPFQFDLDRMHQMPRVAPGASDPLAGLKRVAAEAANQGGAKPDDHLRIAEALESYLMTKGGFEYSLQEQPRTAGLDPIEDFVTVNRKGHCEYFASALTLMLRSQGIPARMVIGFKGGEWNPLGRYYQVRQLHCHAWVEAYLSEEQLEQHDIDYHGYTHGAWLTLDPTSLDFAALNDSRAGLFRRVSATLDYVEMLWITYVVGLTKKQQEENIYQPISDFYYDFMQQIREFVPTAPEHGLRLQVYAVLKWFQANWLSWRGLAAGVFLALFGYSLVRLARYAWQKLRRMWRHTGAERNAGEEQRIEFYRRLESLLAPHGFRRLAVQTQREFATAAGGQMAESPQLRDAAPIPRGIVDAYYQVRFGGRALDSQQAHAVEQALTELETTLRRPAHTLPSPGGNGPHGQGANGRGPNGHAAGGNQGK